MDVDKNSFITLGSRVCHKIYLGDVREYGFKGFLIGENFMRTEDPGAAAKVFINSIQG